MLVAHLQLVSVLIDVATWSMDFVVIFVISVILGTVVVEYILNRSKDLLHTQKKPYISWNSYFTRLFVNRQCFSRREN